MLISSSVKVRVAVVAIAAMSWSSLAPLVAAQAPTAAKPAAAKPAAAAAVTPPPADGGWPRAYTTASGAALVIHQPQVSSWTDQKRVVAFAAVSYMLMMAAALVLRKKRPDLHRPYKARGGRVTMWIALILAGILIPAALVSFPLAFVIAVIMVALFMAYYFAVGRKRVGNYTAEEELALTDQALTADA